MGGGWRISLKKGGKKKSHREGLPIGPVGGVIIKEESREWDKIIEVVRSIRNWSIWYVLSLPGVREGEEG